VLSSGKKIPAGLIEQLYGGCQTQATVDAIIDDASHCSESIIVQPSSMPRGGLSICDTVGEFAGPSAVRMRRTQVGSYSNQIANSIKIQYTTFVDNLLLPNRAKIRQANTLALDSKGVSRESNRLPAI